VAVIPALRLQPERDPLFLLSGGPGQAASDFYLSVAPAFARIRRDRDIVLIDQRGTGRSNRLDCNLPEEGELAAADLDQLREAVRACLAAMPGDPRHYTTSVAVRDLDEVRAALGYDAISLYGVSYGTRVAQQYMRRYPGRVRAAILDGVVPPHLALGPDIALVAQQALDVTFARCAADVRCNEAFPGIDGRFLELRSRVRAQPFAASIPDPVTAQLTPATLGEAQLAAAVRLLSYSDETSSVLPLLIHEAHAQRPQALAAQYLMIRDALKEQLAQGMHFAVVCSEDAPRWPQQLANDAELARTYMGLDFMKAMRAICGEWPRGAVDPDFGEPLRTDVPTLLLSGEADPATPARYADQVLPGFSAARHLTLAGQGHGQIAVGCVPRLAAEFIRSASAQSLDATCVKLVQPTPFMLSLTSPAP
jgi:pimeloyl-ACP methyl ester carboxylesterase